MMVAAVTVDLVGYVAATLTTISFLPQLIRVIRLRSARDISLVMFMIFSLGTFLWMVYGFLSHSPPVWMANVITFSLSVSILTLKLRYDRLPSRTVPTEVQHES